jgi:hypothetical protein
MRSDILLPVLLKKKPSDSQPEGRGCIISSTTRSLVVIFNACSLINHPSDDRKYLHLFYVFSAIEAQLRTWLFAIICGFQTLNFAGLMPEIV